MKKYICLIVVVVVLVWSWISTLDYPFIREREIAPEREGYRFGSVCTFCLFLLPVIPQEHLCCRYIPFPIILFLPSDDGSSFITFSYDMVARCAHAYYYRLIDPNLLWRNPVSRKVVTLSRYLIYWNVIRITYFQNFRVLQHKFQTHVFQVNDN